MRTMKFLMCAACLSSAAVFARTAMTQEKPVIPPVTDKLVPADEVPGPTEDPGPGDANFLTGPPTDAGFYLRDSIPSLPAMRQRRVTRTVIENLMEPIPQDELEASRKLQAAVQSLKTGNDEAARKVSADVIQQQLTTQFESDLKQREKELAEVEQRVKTLREQLDKRKAAQAEIINLRLQTLVNEANGLGFPDEDFRTDDLFEPQVPITPRVDRFESDLDRDGSFLTPVNPESNPTRRTDPSDGFNDR